MFAVLALAGPSTASAAKWRSCPAFSYEHRTSGETYRFTKLKVTGARCGAIKKVVVGYFRDKGAPAGDIPSAGYNVYGWNVLIHTCTLDGRKLKGAGRFRGGYC